MGSRFNSLLFIIVTTAATPSVVQSMGLNYLENEESDDFLYEEGDERLFVLPAVSLKLNISTLAANMLPLMALAAAAASLITSVVLASVLFSLYAKLKYDNGYYGSHSGFSSYGSGSAHSGSYRR